MWLRILMLASLAVLSAASESRSKEELRQVDHPPVVEEQQPDVPVNSLPHSSGKPRTDLDISFYHGFLASLSVIIVSELGDKTWFIAVIMAMRHSRLTVFSGAMGALALMTVLSACLGWVTQLIPRMEEFEEAQAEVAKREMDLDAGKFVDMEAGNAQGTSSSSSAWLIFSFTSRIFIEAFTMTFVAEWGDRSQLTTIILAARENIVGVISGGILGHAICTGIAVIGGKLVAQRISVRTGELISVMLFLVDFIFIYQFSISLFSVTIVGGVVFLIFALSSLFINDADEPSIRVE
ncbi:hypothetical protein TELCIR_08347 [Teladorsagia circumcincta]|uniref:GDT1 family protein n=1 Tax=Teladorsagia circumcincta TaxID=45464 RepID=A0A2G9UJZ0_TELCI|nr:hypothetical protein TELCIR_08347 [Teladorsagia circumcincta]